VSRDRSIGVLHALAIGLEAAAQAKRRHASGLAGNRAGPVRPFGRNVRTSRAAVYGEADIGSARDLRVCRTDSYPDY
jgi:hypothetical protein